jgi:hypothetical protein
LESERAMPLLMQPTHGVASERGTEPRWGRSKWTGMGNTAMAPKAKTDPAIVAWVKELRQSARLEEKLKQLREMQNAPPKAPTKARRWKPPKKRETKKPR